jgi:oxygen-independent coproporphyrinogen-3 oxidase
MKLPPLALYVHIPWCEKKCPYCDFNSHVTELMPEQSYVDQLKRDLDSQLQWVQGRQLASIFIGGGTPSLFSAQSIGEILHFVASNIPLAPNIEITMEANPSSSEQAKFADLLSLGVNRLSIGVQSFNNDSLKAIGRIHHSQEAVAAVVGAQKAGFKRLNIDLMHGLPHQSLEKGLDDIKQALDLGVSHLSWYQLTIEQNTPFYSKPPALPVDELIDELHSQGLAMIKQAGLAQYEVSAFAKVGQESLHNLNYWQFGDYLAIGAGAHGKVSMSQGKFRFNRTRVPKHYLSSELMAPPELIQISSEDLLFEVMMNGLRLKKGLKTDWVLDQLGMSINQLQTALAELVNEDLLIVSAERVLTTAKGYRYLNKVLESLLPA